MFASMLPENQRAWSNTPATVRKVLTHRRSNGPILTVRILSLSINAQARHPDDAARVRDISRGLPVRTALSVHGSALATRQGWRKPQVQDIRTFITGVLKYITNPTFHALRSWWIVYTRTRWPFTEGYGRMLVPFLFSFETLSDWGKWFFTARPAR